MAVLRGEVAVLLLLASLAPLSWAHELPHPLARIATPRTVQALDPRISLSLNTTSLPHSGAWVEVAWRGVVGATPADWLAVMLANADPSQTAPLKWRMAAESPTWLRGEGRLRFKLLSYAGRDLQLAFFRGSFARPLLAARSPVLTPAAPNEPLFRRLSLTGDPTRMLVSWNSRNASRPLVQWGSGARSLTRAAPAASSSYSRGQLCGPPATSVGWLEPGLIHRATLTGLLPGRTYWYRVGDEAWGWSPVASFTAPPAPGDASAPLRLLAVADMGQAEPDGSMQADEIAAISRMTAARLAAELAAGGVSLLAHLGDLSYARGYASQWTNFLAQIEPLASRVPYMTAAGNHEENWPRPADRFRQSFDSGGECGRPMEALLAMPTPGRDKPWYSFEAGPVHFLIYSTEHAFAPGSEQHAWVLADLASVDRTRTPWLIVGGHRPMYISSTFDPPGLDWGDLVVAAALRDAFEASFIAAGVDLSLHGHHHSYQRSCPAANYSCQPPGAAPVHLVIGHAGASLSLNVEPRPHPIWQVVRLAHGYLRLTASSAALAVESVDAVTGRRQDAFELTRPRPA